MQDDAAGAGLGLKYVGISRAVKPEARELINGPLHRSRCWGRYRERPRGRGGVGRGRGRQGQGFGLKSGVRESGWLLGVEEDLEGVMGWDGRKPWDRWDREACAVVVVAVVVVVVA